jgi:hypothetical protein
LPNGQTLQSFPYSTAFCKYNRLFSALALQNYSVENGEQWGKLVKKATVFDKKTSTDLLQISAL